MTENMYQIHQNGLFFNVIGRLSNVCSPLCSSDVQGASHLEFTLLYFAVDVGKRKNSGGGGASPKTDFSVAKLKPCYYHEDGTDERSGSIEC